MAKEPKTGNLRAIALVVGLIMIAAGVFADFVLQGASIESNKEAIVELKEDGCDLAQDQKSQIAVTKAAIVTIKETMTEIKDDHKQFQHDLLKQLQLKPTEP